MEDIINWVEHGLNTETICEELNLCKPALPVDPMMSSMANPAKVQWIIDSLRLMNTNSMMMDRYGPKDKNDGASPDCMFCDHFVAVLDLVRQHYAPYLPVLKDGLSIACAFCPEPEKVLYRLFSAVAPPAASAILVLGMIS